MWSNIEHRCAEAVGCSSLCHAPSDPIEALFDQLRARPLDKELRGVYADWLEQHGFVMVLRAQTGALRDLLGT